MRRFLIVLIVVAAACSIAHGQRVGTDKPSDESLFSEVADVTVNPGSLDFGKQVIGSASKAQRVTVTNSGSAKTYVNSVAVGGDDWQQFRVVGDTCTGATLAPQKSCIIDVVCTPAKQGGIKTVLTITIGDGTQTVTLSGTGINSVDVPPSDEDL